ncbi:MAG: DUF4199 domain-containing protein [Saprospiraceae bacterium]|nr:DUF4199 domain-containing protein [Saprospiraceae bacterium]
MNESKPGPIILRYGLTGGLITSLIFLIATVGGLANPSNTYSNILIGCLSFLALVTMVVIATRKQRDEFQGGFISLSQCILIGVGVVLLAALISSVISLIYIRVVDPGYMDRMMSGMEEAWEAQGFDEEQIEQAKSMTNIMKNPFLSIASNLLCFGVGGLVLSLITGLIMKKDRPEFT